ncbi:DinB family protein [Neolewinella aurantiaca]|uniref:DinB family protein n=1 Tax=Neolewinella aurantiaca TaxID=2602767 RepID=A0A5C7FCY6_9BACT|nr:DinB family protein [Neolewinella aurantiaca]TXF88826.1 DinB family protein [Neolewinella aurantiaca]
MLTNYLAKHLNTVYASQPWYGSGVLESLNKIPEEKWHQQHGHRTISDLIGHVIAWRNFAIARLDGRTDFGIEMNTEEDWPDCSGLSKAILLQQLADTQVALLATLERLTDADLDTHFPSQYGYSRGDLALGIMQHDIYHTGQINLLAKLLS